MTCRAPWSCACSVSVPVVEGAALELLARRGGSAPENACGGFCDRFFCFFCFSVVTSTSTTHTRARAHTQPDDTEKPLLCGPVISRDRLQSTSVPYRGGSPGVRGVRHSTARSALSTSSYHTSLLNRRNKRSAMGDQGRPGSGPIRFKTTFTNTIYEAMKRRGWRETNSDSDWDFIWAER